MRNNNMSGDDNKNKENQLIKQLELQMKNAQDESTVEEIRRIVSELDKLSPTKTTSDKNIQHFSDDFYLDALKDREFIKTFEAKETSKKVRFMPFNKFSVATLLVLVFLGLSSVVAIGGLGSFMPIIQWAGDTLNKKHKNTNDSGEGVEGQYSSYEELEKAFGTIILKPTKLPSGYKLKSIDVVNMDFFKNIIISYSRDDNMENEIIYTLKIQASNEAFYDEKIEISSEYQRKYLSNGMDFYLFKNLDTYGSTFQNMNISYIVSGFESENQTIDFVDSLKKD